LQVDLPVSSVSSHLGVRSTADRARDVHEHFDNFGLSRRHNAKTTTLLNEQRQTKLLNTQQNCCFCNTVSNFSRAYNGALTAAGLSQADASRVSGVNTSTLSRIMSDELPASQEHVEKLLLPLASEADRHHCLCAYVIDQVPRD